MTSRNIPVEESGLAAQRRLDALSPLDAAAAVALSAAAARATIVPVRNDLLAEGAPIVAPLLILNGWAARVHLLADGRRQLAGFLLPGDIIGMCGYECATAWNTVTALSAVTVCSLPDRSAFPTLDRAYALSRATDEYNLTCHITRLGRMSAYERIVDLFLELHERLMPTGLADADGFAMPLTQETLADALGLTAVHFNRMLQQARRTGDLDVVSGRVTIRNAGRLRRSVGRRTPRDRSGSSALE